MGRLGEGIKTTRQAIWNPKCLDMSRQMRKLYSTRSRLWQQEIQECGYRNRYPLIAKQTNKHKEHKMISRKKAIEILIAHGLGPDDQTCSELINGKPVGVKSGTSFDEEIGCRQAYSLKTIKDWLGY